MGEAAATIATSLQGHKIEQFDNLKMALEAISHAKDGDTILFSPACTVLSR